MDNKNCCCCCCCCSCRSRRTRTHTPRSRDQPNLVNNKTKNIRKRIEVDRGQAKFTCKYRDLDQYGYTDYCGRFSVAKYPDSSCSAHLCYDRSCTQYRTPRGKYCLQHTCSDCGSEWVDNVARLCEACGMKPGNP